MAGLTALALLFAVVVFGIGLITLVRIHQYRRARRKYIEQTRPLRMMHAYQVDPSPSAQEAPTSNESTFPSRPSRFPDDPAARPGHSTPSTVRPSSHEDLWAGTDA